jgi:DNA-binding transcriptional LysR family regulator
MKHLRTLSYINAIARTGSIRKTAENVNLTPSALNRQILDFERQIGTQIFERLPTGVRLNAAGELIVRHIRDQLSDFERVKSQIADLSGLRRGHVAIACSQAFASDIMPQEIERYRSQFPLVSFEVRVCDHREAIAALDVHEVDLALIFQPSSEQDFQILLSYTQPLCALMSAGHPLAGITPVRLRECLRYPLILPDQSTVGRYLFDVAIRRAQLSIDPVIVSNSFEFMRNYLLREPLIAFQVTCQYISQPKRARRGLILRPIDRRDVTPARMALGQLRGRSLPVASVKFAEQLSRSLRQRFCAS